jgi:hypothetical protein
MIDDFEVPGDSGYAYDDYGPGKRLWFHDFPLHNDNRISAYCLSSSSVPSQPISLQLRTLSRITSAVAFQKNGLAVSFQLASQA